MLEKFNRQHGIKIMGIVYKSSQKWSEKTGQFFGFSSVLSRQVTPLRTAIFVRRIRSRAFGCQVSGAGVFG